MPFTITANVRLKKDVEGVTRHISHLQQPYMFSGGGQPMPQALAGEYVRDVASIFGLGQSWLDTLGEPIDRTLKAERSQLRFREIKRLPNATIVAFQQTYLGIPIWGAHVQVRIHDAPLRVTSSESFAHHDVRLSPPRKDARYLPGKRNTAALLRRIVETAKGKLLEITLERLLVYRYGQEARFDPEATPRQPRESTRRRMRPSVVVGAGVPTLPLSAVPNSFQDGRYYVVNEVLFSTSLGPWKLLHWRAFIEVETGAVVYLRALVTHAFGNVFQADPITLTGNASLSPSSTAATLDPITTVLTLPGLLPPPAGNPQTLTGVHVTLGELSSPNIAGPTAALPSGNFSRSCTTDDFAAVNVYYHCDALFRTMEEMGINLANYFPDTTFPLTIDHRDASLGTVNARAYGNATGDGAGGMGFNLADDASPITISADPRIVWHEFGHELLFEHVGGPNFGFAHSPGDSLGVIMLDPDSRAPDRFSTFPWVPDIVRRHDRAVSGGWGWGGTQSDTQYNGEQVLSTTLFRLYRSTGGDASDVNQRRLAARYVAYLIIQGCGLLTTTTTDPEVYATAMMDADTGTPEFEGIAGGGVHKVVRWAFEKQGLYRTPGTPTTAEGAPPDIDVYIDDGRAGNYDYLGNFWNSTSIWNRLSPGASGTESDHETPIVGVSNYLFVRVSNRGTQTAPNVLVRAYHCIPATGLVWPDDWQESSTGSIAVADIPASGDTIVGPFEWTPEVVGHECLLATASADGDLANTDPASMLPTATGPIPHWRLVPFDNNIAQRNVAPVPGGGGARALQAAFDRRRFWARNPYSRPIRIQLQTHLPDILARRGYELRFTSAGGKSFTLGPRANREVMMDLRPGSEFTSNEIGANTKIEVRVLGDGILIGGMSYLLDPNLTNPPRERPYGPALHGGCGYEASELLNCLHVPHKKVKGVRVRRVTLDVDLEDDC